MDETCIPVKQLDLKVTIEYPSGPMQFTLVWMKPMTETIFLVSLVNNDGGYKVVQGYFDKDKLFHIYADALSFSEQEMNNIRLATNLGLEESLITDKVLKDRVKCLEQ